MVFKVSGRGQIFPFKQLVMFRTLIGRKLLGEEAQRDLILAGED